MKYTVIVGIFCILICGTSFGMEGCIAVSQGQDPFADECEPSFMSYLTSSMSRCIEWYMMESIEEREDSIINYLKSGKVDDAKRAVEGLYKNNLRPRFDFIKEVISWKTGQEILPLLIKALSDSIDHSSLLVLTLALQCAAQEGSVDSIKSLNSFFEGVYHRWGFSEFTFLDKESYKKNSDWGPYGPLYYETICSAYLKAFDRAANNGHLEVLKELYRLEYLNSKSCDWRSTYRSPYGPFSSALHAVLLADKKYEDVVLFLLQQNSSASLSDEEKSDLADQYGQDERISKFLAFKQT